MFQPDVAKTITKLTLINCDKQLNKWYDKIWNRYNYKIYIKTFSLIFLFMI